VAIVLVCMAASQLQGDALLVSTQSLLALEDALVVDARPLEDYAEAHIPGALHLDYASLSETRDGVRGLLRPVAALRNVLSEAGVNPERHVVVYSDSSDPQHLTFATRVFWVLEYLGYPRVSVLDGGLTKWNLESRAVEKGGPKTNRIELPLLEPRPELMATRDETTALLDGGAGVLLDSRPPGYYFGEQKKDYVARRGHIPGAVNLPYEAHVTGPAHVFRARKELEKDLESLGAAPGAPVVAYCNSGRAASFNYFTARLLGRGPVAVYDGSFVEWAAQEECEVVTDAGDEDIEKSEGP